MSEIRSHVRSQTRMWVKICGTTNLEDALHAANAGADALGFVFAPSPRQVSVEQVRRIVPHLPQHAQTYGVFVDASVDEIVRTVLECGLSGVQLHSVRQAGQIAILRRRFLAHHAEATRIVSVLKFNDGAVYDSLPQQLAAAAADADAVLVDSGSATRAGGTGQRWDWASGSAALRRAAGQVRVIAAGGLAPENVEEAIDTLAPWGVDVVTGVEASPGRKDWWRVQDFIERAKGGTPGSGAVRSAVSPGSGAS